MRSTALAGVRDIDAAVELLGALQKKSGEKVEAFEIMPGILLDIVSKQFPNIPMPLSPMPEFMVLMKLPAQMMKIASLTQKAQFRLPLMEQFLADNFETGLVTDAVLRK